MELGGDLGAGDRAEVEALQAREHRGADLGWVGGAEDEDDPWWRLLEPLQEGVPGVIREAVHLVEDEDLALQVGWRVRNKGDQVLAHVVDAVGGGGVGFDHVEGGALCNGDARAAGAAGFALGGGEAVERLGNDAGG